MFGIISVANERNLLFELRFISFTKEISSKDSFCFVLFFLAILFSCASLFLKSLMWLVFLIKMYSYLLYFFITGVAIFFLINKKQLLAAFCLFNNSCFFKSFVSSVFLDIFDSFCRNFHYKSFIQFRNEDSFLL